MIPGALARSYRLGAVFFILLAFSVILSAQFKEVGPPPFPPKIAREKIKTLLEKVDATNRPQTIKTLMGLLAWYRDVLDEELIAAWKRDTRANLPEVLKSLADPRVTAAVVEFSWQQRSSETFNLTYAPMFSDLMTRFPESAKSFKDDLLDLGSTGQPPLLEPEAETVCRILIDMPDVGTWKKDALRIMRQHRSAAEAVLRQDLHGSDQDKSYQAQVWLSDLKIDTTGSPRAQTARQPIGPPDGPPTGRRRPGVSESSVIDRGPIRDQEEVTTAALPVFRAAPVTPPAAVNPALPPPVRAVATPSVPPYAGPESGTLESSGGPIPQNGEYVFRNVPPVKLRLEYDTRIWEARLSAGDGTSQRLIARNKSSSPQKRCVIRWSVTPN
jgi:hypothetical protein